ncbi:MAG TPA: HD domain-containing phosphohydrolase [Marmoricola sp.]|nr:HD domain-containing phosphohydrolase [Marmoricola sp.]
MESARDSGITLAELLAAFSLATDLGLGQPMEHVLRSWWIADQVAARMGMDEAERCELFYVALLAWVGCVADAPEVAAMFGDDIAFRAASYDVDLTLLSATRFFLSHAGAGKGLAERARLVALLLATGGNRVVRGLQAHCVSTSAMADRLGLGPAVSSALRQFFARWDGAGVPRGLRGTDIALAVRLFHLADLVEVHDRRDGPPAALRVVRARRESQLDPQVVDAFCLIAEDVLGQMAATVDPYQLVSASPWLRRTLSEAELESALEVLADFTDLRSVHRSGHSRRVAEVAGAAAATLGLPSGEVDVVRRAGLLHDVGLHGVPASILDKPGELSATERERMRLSSYYTERVLARPAELARIGALAALVHERMDGSGYHRGLPGPAIPLGARVLAAACAYQEMVEPRAQRPALPAARAASQLRADVRAGLLDADAADAVLVAAGGAGRRRMPGPAGLTAREREVLVLIARGASTRDVARELGISQRTAGTHIERIYTKTGVSSRSTATLFALRNGLLDPLAL